MTLIEFIRELVGVDRMQMRDLFERDPHAVLAQYGLSHLTVEDVHDAMVLVRDNEMISFAPEHDDSTAFGNGGAIRDMGPTTAGVLPSDGATNAPATEESLNQTSTIQDTAGTADLYDENTVASVDSGADRYSPADLVPDDHVGLDFG